MNHSEGMANHRHHEHMEHPSAAPAEQESVPHDHGGDGADHAKHQGYGGDHAKHEGHGGDHSKHEGHSPEMFRDRLWVSLLLTVPILYFSAQVQDWLGYEAASFPGSDALSPVVATVLFGYAGVVFLKGGYHELRGRRPGMMTLISIAITVAYGYSLAVSLGVSGKPFYWELATLLDVMLLGHWIEMRSIRSAGRALGQLAAMVPATAHRVAAAGSLEEIPVEALAVTDAVLIRPGEQVPADGEITEGASSMNEAFLTGESRPVPKEVGDEVIAGAVNGEGALTVVVTRTGDSTTLSQMMRLVEEAQTSRSRFQTLADRAAAWLTVVAVGVSIPTLVVWLLVGSNGTSYAVARAVTVLVITCPHALGLAIPLVTVNATSVSARNGILVRNRESFERGRSIELVAFDKTGTLTEGRFVVSQVTTAPALGEDEALALAASLERSSEHPLAAAIVEAATQRGLSIDSGADVHAVAGQGIEGRLGGRLHRVGRPEWAEELGVGMPSVLQEALDRANERGESAVVLMAGDAANAVVTLSDKVRDGAKAAIERLRDLGMVPIMVTGDAEAVAAAVAGELGIDRYYSRVLPQDKAHIVRDLREEGPTAFVGDGINDAPALLTADLGIAVGAGTNVAIESADLVLVEDDPADVVQALILSRRTHRKMLQNLAWATGYNTVAIPLAAGVAAGAGIVLSPAVGALLMSLSTVIVAANAMLLRRARLT